MSTNFLLTKYFYPISHPITLSNYFNFKFDNPRTEQEIEYVKKFLTDQYESGIVSMLPPYSEDDIVTLESIIESFRVAYSEEDEYVKKFLKGYKRENLFEYFARMWCVIRFDDEGETERLERIHKEYQEKGVNNFFVLEDNHPIIRNSEALINYSYLLAIISHTENDDYFGRNFLFEPKQLYKRVLLENLTAHFVMIASANYIYQTDPNHQDDLNWIVSWLVGSKQLLKKAQSLDTLLKNGNEKKLLYIGNLLEIASETQDEKIKLLMLTSIIELLLTRNPDFNRFNVEDSINKQFQLKASILIYLNNKEKDIDELKKRLKIIYQQRSNIAHGNFKELEKYKNNLSKKEGKEEYFEDLVSDLYSYVRAIIEEYVKDPKFVEFIKAS